MNNSNNTAYKTLTTETGEKLAYCRSFVPDAKCGVVFLGGFMSDMNGVKATYLEKVCQKLNISFVRFDYFGHGASSGSLKEGSLTLWRNNALAVLESLTEGPQILVGSSMGGWLMLLVALQRPEKIKALLGIAAAPDFIKDFSRLNAEQKAALDRDGICYLPSRYGDPYPITRHLLEDGITHCLLDKPVNINCPVRLVHGLADEQVSWQHSLELAEKLTSKDVQVTLIKDGDHRLSEEQQLSLLEQQLKSLMMG